MTSIMIITIRVARNSNQTIPTARPAMAHVSSTPAGGVAEEGAHIRLPMTVTSLTLSPHYNHPRHRAVSIGHCTGVQSSVSKRGTVDNHTRDVLVTGCDHCDPLNQHSTIPSSTPQWDEECLQTHTPQSIHYQQVHLEGRMRDG